MDYAFSLTQSVAFVGLASEFLTQQGMPGETSRALRAGLRVQFLGFLRAKGYQVRAWLRAATELEPDPNSELPNHE